VTIRRNRALRGALVGFGNVAVHGHVPAWKTDRHFSMLAVCDPDEAQLAIAAELLPDTRRYTNVDELLATERLDFIDVATPPMTHGEIVLKAAAHRVNVLCEKPLVTSMEECGRIRSAASAAHVVVFTGHNWKYAPIFRTAKRVLRRGEVGKITHVELQTLRMQPPGGTAAAGDWRLDAARSGGGILVDHGWHAFYLALYALDAEPLAVSARTSSRKFVDSAVEDTASCTIEFPDTTAEIFLTWAADERRNTARFTGTQGTIDVADRVLAVRVAERPPVETAFAQPLSAGSYHPDWFAAMLEDFREELYEPKLRGTNFREAEACCRLLELAYRSAAADGARLPFRDPLPPVNGGAGTVGA
jgi:predicted dehydrogenase